MRNFKLFMGAIMVMCMVAGITYAQPITKPHTFVPDTPANAEEVNENFDVLYNKANQLDNQVCTGQITKWVSIPAAAFHGRVSTTLFPEHGEAHWQHRFSGHYLHALGVGSNVDVFASISFPNGAEIERIRLYAEDNRATQDITCRVLRNELPGNHSGSSGLVRSTGAMPDVRSFEIVSGPAYKTVDNSMHVFWVKCDWEEDTFPPSGLALYGVAVEYSIPSPCE